MVRRLLRNELSGKLILALLSTVGVLMLIELAVRWFTAGATVYPGVIYQTDDPSLELWCYDEHFIGVADGDLRQDHGYGALRYAGNFDDDPQLAGLEPQVVYNAVEVRLNSLQFRARPTAELVQAMARRSAVTLVVGDSFCFGQGVRMQDRFSDAIQNQLYARGSDHTIYNMCVPGMNIQRIARVQREAVKRFGAPTRILYAYTLNDPIRDAQTLAIENSLYDLMHFRRGPFKAPPRSLLWRSATWQWLQERRAKQQVANRTVVWYNRLYEDNPGWRQTARMLAEMQAFCAARDIEFALVVFPLFHQLSDYPLQEAHRKLEALAAREEMEFVDLLAVFAGDQEQAYWVHPTDFHPNGRAHRLVAEYLLQKLAW